MRASDPSGGGEISRTAAVFTVDDEGPDDVPSPITIDKSTGDIEIDWQLVLLEPDDYYEVRRSDGIGNPFETITPPDYTSTDFVDTTWDNDGIYYYYVRTIDPCGNGSRVDPW